MPEGPSIIIVKEALESFVGSKVFSSSGSSKIDYDRMNGKTILALKTWGKHFLIVFPDFTLRIHFLMFGTYSIDERKTLKPRLSLQFARQHEINFYTCAVKWIEGPIEDAYDWSAYVMSDHWRPAATKKRLQDNPEMMVCDVLMNQNIFSGVGNIIKNEVLFRIYLHPETFLKNIPTIKVNQLVKEVRKYSFQFLEWKKEFILKKHWLIYGKKKCPRCKIPTVKRLTGTSKRTSHFCTNCQLLYPLSLSFMKMGSER